MDRLWRDCAIVEALLERRQREDTKDESARRCRSSWTAPDAQWGIELIFAQRYWWIPDSRRVSACRGTTVFGLFSGALLL